MSTCHKAGAVEQEAISISQLCTLLGIGRKTAYRLVEDGAVKGRRMEKGRWLISKRSALEWLEGKEGEDQRPSFLHRTQGTPRYTE